MNRKNNELKNKYKEEIDRQNSKNNFHYIYLDNILNFIDAFEKGSSVHKFYKDPDDEDVKLYERVTEKWYSDYKANEPKKCNFQNEIKNKTIRFSLDCVIGWKDIKKCYEESNDNFVKEFVELYAEIRNPENAGHFIWPVRR